MGYTHYWDNTEISGNDWEHLCESARLILDACGIATQSDSVDDSRYQIDAAKIEFNGVGEDSHETFWIDKNGTDFSFCKTARKDYDLPVVAILLWAHHNIEGFDVRSDGDIHGGFNGDEYNERTPALQLLQKLGLHWWLTAPDAATV